MWQKIRPFFTGLGIFVSLLILMGFVSFFTFRAKALAPLPNSIVLTFNIDSSFGERRTFDFQKRSEIPSIHDVVFALNEAAKDMRVRAVYVRLSHQNFSLSEVQELRSALNKLHESGKILKIFSENYAGLGSGISNYYFASFFDEIWLQPTGSTDISKIEAEMPFFRNALEKIGVKPEISKAGRFKNAPEIYTESEMSEDNRVMMTRLLSSVYMQAQNDIKKNKIGAPLDWERATLHSPLTDLQSLEWGLVSRLGYFDEFETDLNGTAENYKADIIDIWNYRKRKSKEFSLKDAPQVAFFILDGAIPEPDVQTHQASFGAKNTIIPADIQEAMQRVAKDDDIKAVLVRVNSPGGSPSGSETIRRSIEIAKNAGKKVYVSMGRAAASGGYWIIADADVIVANPATLTGSIGVYGGKMSLQRLWEKLSINWGLIADENPSHFWSPNFDYSERGQKILEHKMKTTYKQFTQRVAQGRNMDDAQVEKIAQGQVWTGFEALENGLVDKLGGIGETISLIKQDLGLSDDERIILVHLPEPKSPFDIFLSFIGQFIYSQTALSNFILSFQHGFQGNLSPVEAQMRKAPLF